MDMLTLTFKWRYGSLLLREMDMLTLLVWNGQTLHKEISSGYICMKVIYFTFYKLEVWSNKYPQVHFKSS